MHYLFLHDASEFQKLIHILSSFFASIDFTWWLLLCRVYPEGQEKKGHKESL